MEKYSSLLLIGPTGSGKTPLGDHLERHGLAGRRCWHFDFGARLRSLAQAQAPFDPFSPEDITYIREVLAANRLLDNDHFYIALRLLRLFIREKGVAPADLIILNGLPRHVDQARQLAALVRVERVVYLECPPETVWHRIRRDTGGDRRGRTDDSLAEVQNKLAIFRERTFTLLDYYRRNGIPVSTVPVTAAQTPDQLAPLVAARGN